MSKSRAAIFTTRVAMLAGSAALVVALPFLGATTASAGDDAPPPPTPTATTDGHDWND